MEIWKSEFRESGCFFFCNVRQCFTMSFKSAKKKISLSFCRKNLTSENEFTVSI